MKMNYSKILVGVMVAMFFSNMSVRAEEDAKNVRHLSGRIEQIDVNLGTIVIKSNISPNIGDVTEYRINKNDTRVTDPLDQKFLTIDDLQAGQYVIVDVVNGEADKVVKKITAEPYVAPGLEQAFGSLESITPDAGSLILVERPMGNDVGQGQLAYFVFDPMEIIVMKYPSMEPVRMTLNSGDLVRVVYVNKDGKNHAQTITLYPPKGMQTVVTTTTTTTN